MYFKEPVRVRVHLCPKFKKKKKSLTQTFLVVCNGLVIRGPPGELDPLTEQLSGKVGGSRLIRDNPVKNGHYLRGTLACYRKISGLTYHQKVIYCESNLWRTR